MGMESLESRELLSINPLGYDGSYDNSDTVQTSQTFAGESDFSTEVASASEVTATSCKVAWEASTDGTGLVKITLTPQGGGSSIVETVASSDITAAGSATISGLTAGTAYNITVEGATSAGTAQTSTVTTLAATGGGSAVTNSVGTTSGLTTDAVTITWTKPTVYTGGTNDVALKGAGNYTLTITNNANSADTITIDAATLKTKTSWATTGLTAGATYTFTVTTDKLTAKDGTAISASSTFVVATGEFTALAEGDAAKVTVGHPTDLKTAWTDKDKTVKVTWKAPANYTGGYTVTFTDKAMADAKAADSSAPAADTFIRTIAAGSKLELIVATGSAFSAATAGSELLAVDTFYNVEIKADVTNSITSKTICYTGKTAPAVNDPATPALKAESVAGAASATPGVVTVTITHNTSNVTGSVTDGTVGYYVGYDASATPTQPTDFSKFIYVAKASGTATKTTVDLVGDTKYAVVYAVAADGSVSAVTATTAALATGATAADEDGKYTALPASNATHTMIGAIGQNTTSVTFVADTTAKNSVKISGIAIPSAGVPVGTDATTTKPAAASDTLLKATGTLVSYSADGGTTWQSVALAADKTETTLTGLKWGTAYQFKVEVLFETYKAEAGSPADGVTPYTWETTATGPKGLGKAITKTLTIAAAPKVATPVKHATPVDLNTGTTATVQWTSVAGTNYQVKLIDANKAVLATDTITDGSGKWAITGLIPKGKYTVEVVALGTVPGTVSAPLKISVTASDDQGRESLHDHGH